MSNEGLLSFVPTRSSEAPVRRADRRNRRTSEAAIPPPGMPLYGFFWGLGQFVFLCTMRAKLIRPETPPRMTGGYLLALTHLGHVDPFCCSVLSRRPIWWMARREFFEVHRV